MNRYFRFLLISLCIPVGYLGVKYALETRQISNFRKLPFRINHSINIADQIGVIKNGKLFLTCGKDESLRLIYKAKLPVNIPKRGKGLRFDASLLFSNYHSDYYKSFEVDFSQPVTLHSEESILFGWLSTIFTEPLTRKEYNLITDILTSKTYENLAFFGLETGTYFTFDEKYLNRQLPSFLRTCEN